MNKTTEEIALELAQLQKQLTRLRLQDLRRRIGSGKIRSLDLALQRAIDYANNQPYCHHYASEALDEAEALADRYL